MKTYKTIFALLFLLFLAKPSLAIQCKFENYPGGIVEQITQPIIVPPERPAGTIIWRSQEFQVDVTCWQDKQAPEDTVTLFFAPYDYNRALFRGELELGFQQKGSDILCQSGEAICKFNTWTPIPACNNANGCPNQTRAFTMTFSMFLSKKSPGEIGKSGAIVPNPPPLYALAQFRGNEEPVSSNHPSTALLQLRGLNDLHYIGCGSTIDISPRLINFGRIRASTLKLNKTIKEVPITITAQKSCHFPYGLGGSFMPIDGSLTHSNTTLVPPDNSSVGIQMIDVDNNNQKLEFKKEFFIVTKNNNLKILTRNFKARLFWIKSKADIGIFTTTAKLDVYYR